MINLYIDMIIRIKNGYLARKELVEVRFSNLNREILKKMKSLGLVKDFKIEGEKVKKITVLLNYNDKEPAIGAVKIYSKPGRRWYCSYREIKPVLGGMGVSFISTPKGVLTDKEVRRLRIGGELLFSLW
jgi:small subunit ribosomal protein S8